MALRIFKNKGETNATPINADNLNYNFKEILNLAYPINKTEIFHDNEDHSNFLGFTWERTAIGKAIVGIDSGDTDFNAVGKIGGEKNVVLTIDKIPSHGHTIPYSPNVNGDAVAIAQYIPQSETLTNETNGRGWSNAGTAQTGGDQPHNNLQPYQVFAIWKRIA